MSENEGLIGLRNSIDKEYSKIRKEREFKENQWRNRNSFCLGWEDDEGGYHSYCNYRKDGESVAEFVLRSLKEIIDFELKVENEESTETDHS